MTIGEKIKAARERAGMTQKQLAEKLDVSFTLISQYERGVRKPKIETLMSIATALNTTLDDISSFKSEDIPSFFSLPIEAGMVSTLAWHARKNHRTLEQEIDIAIDTYLEDVSMMGELEDEYYTPEGENRRKFEEAQWRSYFELEEIVDLLNNEGFQKVMSFARDLAKISEYKKDEMALSENAQAVEPPQSTGETPTPDAEKNGGEEE